MADKELSVMFARLAGGSPVWGAEIATDRAADAEELRATIPGDVLRETGPTSRVFPEALRRAHQEGGYLLVFGSIYLVGEAFELVGLTPDDLVTFR
jgi:folylpolyglutamate synthase/dihydropteroate synthase